MAVLPNLIGIWNNVRKQLRNGIKFEQYSKCKYFRGLCKLKRAFENISSSFSFYLRYGHFSGINRKVQLKYLKPREIRTSDGEDTHQQSALMLILKWGGELTTAGFFFEKGIGSDLVAEQKKKIITLFS